MRDESNTASSLWDDDHERKHLIDQKIHSISTTVLQLKEDLQKAEGALKELKQEAEIESVPLRSVCEPSELPEDVVEEELPANTFSFLFVGYWPFALCCGRATGEKYLDVEGSSTSLEEASAKRASSSKEHEASKNKRKLHEFLPFWTACFIFALKFVIYILIFLNVNQFDEGEGFGFPISVDVATRVSSVSF